MTGLRLWIVLLAAVAFLAGIPAGVLIGEGLRPPAEPEGPFADYAARLQAEFDLGPEQRLVLEAVLIDYERSLDEVRSRQLGAFEDEIVRLGRLCHDRIRDGLLASDEDRRRFDRLSEPFAAL